MFLPPFAGNWPEHSCFSCDHGGNEGTPPKAYGSVDTRSAGVPRAKRLPEGKPAYAALNQTEVVFGVRECCAGDGVGERPVIVLAAGHLAERITRTDLLGGLFQRLHIAEPTDAEVPVLRAALEQRTVGGCGYRLRGAAELGEDLKTAVGDALISRRHVVLVPVV